MNISLFLWLNGLAGHGIFLNTLIYFCAHDLIFFFVLGYIGFVWCALQGRRLKIFIVTLLTVLIAFQLAAVIHVVYPEPRPQLTKINVNPVIYLADTASFPSEHTTLAFLLATLFWCIVKRRGYSKKLGIAYLALAAIIAVSRIVAGVHWPIDVLAGIIVGITIGYLSNLLLD